MTSQYSYCQRVICLRTLCSYEAFDTLADDLRKTKLRTETWYMKLNVHECFRLHLRFGSPQKLIIGDIDGITSDLPQVQKASIIIIIIFDRNFKSKTQVVKAVLKARYILTMLNRKFTYQTPEVFILAYSEFVSSQTEYYVQAWSTSLCGDVRQIAGLQREATRLVLCLRHLSYEDRLESLDLFSLEHRPVWSDLRINQFFTPQSSRNRRDHAWMFFKPQL